MSPKKIMRTNDHMRTTTSPGCRRRPPRRKIKKGEDIKSMIFIPHTVDSNLARTLKDREVKLKEITGDKIKVVERAGMKLEDILTRKTPWKGMDCQRPNCFLCTTKVITEKDKTKDCTKRNILYEIRCLT